MLKKEIIGIGLILGFFFVISSEYCLAQGNLSNYDSLSEGFINPSGTARPKVYWWWLNGHTDTTRIKEELQAIKNAGLGGVDIFEIGVPANANPDQMIPAGPAYMGEESLSHIVSAIKEATKLGLEVDLNLSSSWNAGGSWITPEHSAKSLYHSSINIKGGEMKVVTIPFPDIPKVDGRGRSLLIEFAADGRPVYHQEIAVVAVPVKGETDFLDTANILNLSPLFDPDTEVLIWEAPDGEWDIYRYLFQLWGTIKATQSQFHRSDH